MIKRKAAWVALPVAFAAVAVAAPQTANAQTYEEAWAAASADQDKALAAEHAKAAEKEAAVDADNVAEDNSYADNWAAASADQDKALAAEKLAKEKEEVANDIDSVVEPGWSTLLEKPKADKPAGPAAGAEGVKPGTADAGTGTEDLNNPAPKGDQDPANHGKANAGTQTEGDARAVVTPEAKNTNNGEKKGEALPETSSIDSSLVATLGLAGALAVAAAYYSKKRA